jgi:hypothetical protein
MDRENAAEAHSSKCRTTSQPKNDYLTLIKFLKMENSRKRKLPSVKVILVDKMPDYSNDPAVLRKEKIVRAFIEKNGLPHGARKNKGK